jgi:hypothetical protein
MTTLVTTGMTPTVALTMTPTRMYRCAGGKGAAGAKLFRAMADSSQARIRFYLEMTESARTPACQATKRRCCTGRCLGI